VAAITGLLAVVVGFLAALVFYGNAKSEPCRRNSARCPAHGKLLLLDELYEATVIRCALTSSPRRRLRDRWFVEGFASVFARGQQI